MGSDSSCEVKFFIADPDNLEQLAAVAQRLAGELRSAIAGREQFAADEVPGDLLVPAGA